MAKLIYIANVSLDGFTEDADGNFDWTEPSDEYFAFITDLVRPVGTYVLGRRMYETMSVWETDPDLGAQSELNADFARVWQAAEKIVYSTTLDSVATERTVIERRFDPDSVRELVAASPHDVTIGGPEITAHAFHAGLVDECSFFVGPAIVGGGKPALPRGMQISLELLEERRLGSVVYLRYGTRT